MSPRARDPVSRDGSSFQLQSDTRVSVGDLCPLTSDRPVRSKTGRKLELIMDSGAFRSVIPADVAVDYPLLPFEGEPPRIGRTASGEELIPDGRRILTCGFQDGSDKTLDFLVMQKVTKPLGSISQMVARGCRVVFDSEKHGGSFLEHRASKQRHRILAKGGIFVLPLTIRRPAAGFPRQADRP